MREGPTDGTTPEVAGAVARWDRSAIQAGVLIAVTIVIPFSLLAAWAASVGDDGLAIVLNIVAFVGFVLGAAGAAWAQRRSTPMSHGIVAAVLAYAIAQVISIVARWIGGKTTSILQVVFALTLVTMAGLIGGALGGRMRSRGLTPSSQRPPR